ncbi:hypothetical protein ACFV1F_28940 [Streptomyces sp. NPDC059590]|uniref:hypothetical protein n=1 Tax=Streptomyces sp. NPDC059590 TaxID=3346877 RepID=UPI0036CBF747
MHGISSHAPAQAGNHSFGSSHLNGKPSHCLTDALAIDEDVVWAVDVTDGIAALLVNLLLNHGPRLIRRTGSPTSFRTPVQES